MMRFVKVPGTVKGALGLVILTGLIFSGGMQVQQWIDARERAHLSTACEQRVIAVRDSFQQQATERDGVVREVKALADDIRSTSKETLDLLKKRAPITDRIARKVEVIDNKASAAAAESKAAKIEATKATKAAEANSPVPPQSTATINETVRAVNRSSK